jgi:NADH-quinone oxidoreductase subunit L
MGGLRHKMKITYATFLIATLAISGIPGFSGFFSKDEILTGAYEGPLGRPWLYWMGALTAALTAFYMFRVTLLAFHGQSRLSRELEDHTHESGRKMTIPLIALAFFSVVAGYVSWPKPLGGSEAFDRYLDPVFSASEQFLRLSTNSAAVSGPRAGYLMLYALVAALIGILLAYWLYSASPELPSRLVTEFGGLYRVLVRKFYVDELYDWLLVRPVRVGAEKLLWQKIDDGAIDGVLVNGTAAVTAGTGNILRRIQSGNIRSYAAWVLLGAVLWLGYVLFR